MGQALELNKREARLALKGVGGLPWSDAGDALCKKLEKFLEDSR